LSPGAGRVAPGAAKSDSRIDVTDTRTRGAPTPRVRVSFDEALRFRPGRSADYLRSKHRPCWSSTDRPGSAPTASGGLRAKPGRAAAQGGATPAPPSAPTSGLDEEGRASLGWHADIDSPIGSPYEANRPEVRIHVLLPMQSSLARLLPRCADDSHEDAGQRRMLRLVS
jgi:hypothetical protein